MRRIYLAGFDVFRADAVAHGERLKALCREHGFEGLYPLDNALPAELSGDAAAGWIYRQNVTLIRRADLVMANLNPFRGHEPDSGTAFEVGYAVALGKPVWAYTGQDRPLIEQVPGTVRDGLHVDADGYTVEDFGRPLNLMLAQSARVVTGDARACLRSMAAAA
ncbi:nucleoside 2-deoxyribosyltransferase [Bordetella genomosp. 1]|uniref:Nucleoside 2-deoxyribosyltransferase n=1 Tax=Bordetella genomosp. 1 TaxID=1395607 RepID=A0A261STE9_9BORD|nr:nucleoside 2-deoxyribosyltransferase [Bordetella genomosp. 1]OZI40252.1 nucleoside 2-deoxyribosyltransferase [Bordetella genomosp. 1]